VALLNEGVLRHNLSVSQIAALIARDPYDFSKPTWLEAQMEACAAAVGMDWHWEENKYGDKVPAESADPEAWRALGFVEALKERFKADDMKEAAFEIQSNREPSRTAAT